MCLAFGVERLDELGEKVASVLEMQPPQGMGDKLRALGKLKSLADSRAEDRLEGARARRSCSTQPDLDRLPIPTCWPGDGGPFITLPSVFTKDPRTGGRNVGMYRLQKYDATSTGLHWQIHKDAAADWREGAGRMEVAIAIGSDPDHGLRRLVPRAQARRRADGRGLPARQAGRDRAVQDGRPAGARARRDRARGLLRARRAGRRGAVRRPHGLLHARRAVPGAAPDVHDDAPRRDLPEHPGRAAAGRGRLARQGHRAAVPARAAHDAARARRLRPAGRRARSTTAASSRSARPIPVTRARSCTRSGARACSR